MPSARSSDTATACACSGPHKEIRMSSSLHRTGTLLGLVLVLWGGLSWGQLPMGNDISDTEGNTGGGAGALQANTPGSPHTPHRAAPPLSNTPGGGNTPRRL